LERKLATPAGRKA